MLPCSAIPPIHQNQACQRCLPCGFCVLHCRSSASFAFIPVGFSGPFCLLCAVNKLVWGYCGHVIEQGQQSDQTPVLSPFDHSQQSLPCPLRGFCWQVWPVVSPYVCPRPFAGTLDALISRALSPHYQLGCWDNKCTGVCGHFPFSTGQESLRSGAGPCWGCIQDRKWKELLWRNSW